MMFPMPRAVLVIALLLAYGSPAPAETPADAAARSILGHAAKLRHEKRYAEAIAAYSDLIATPGISESLTTQARLEKNATAIEKAEAETPSLEFVRNAFQGAATVLLWIAILLAAFGLASLARFLLPSRRGLLIELQDLSAADRDSGSRMLSAELSGLLTPDHKGAGGDFIFESMPDFEGGASASIKPMVQLPGLDAMLSPTANVSIGPLQFTPASILALLRRCTQPAYEQTLTGSLFQQGTRTAMTLCLAPRRGKGVTWHIAEDGSNARLILLRRAAAQLFLSYAGGTSATRDSGSLECVLQGFGLLRPESGGVPGQQTRREAAQCFQKALAFDPSNWVARFNLSVILRQLGDDESAIQNCVLLEQLLARPTEALKRHIATHPDFPACVTYNHALALSKPPVWEMHKAAVSLFDEILAAPSSVLTLPAKSARAACLLFRFGKFREMGTKAQENARAVRTEIEKVADSMEVAASAGNLSPSLVMSRAVALNALGYVLEADGDTAAARTRLELAVALQPDLVEAHINLGRLYRHAGSKAGEDWVSRARSHLAAALLLQPENRVANYQMGRLLADDAVRDYEGALRFFAAAQPHSLAAFHAGRIYCNHDFSGAHLGKGIEQLRASVSLASATDFRLLELINRLLESGETHCTAAKAAEDIATARACRIRARRAYRTVEEALDRALKHGGPHNHARAERMKERAGRLRGRIRDLDQIGPALPLEDEDHGAGEDE